MREIKYFTLKFTKENEKDYILDVCFDPNEARTYPDINLIEPEQRDAKYRGAEPKSALQHIRNCVREAKYFGYNFDGFVRHRVNKLEKMSTERILMFMLYGK